MSNMDQVKARYEGIQTLLKSCGDEGCNFLSILSIAEEESGEKYDLIDTIKMSLTQGWIEEDFYVRDALALLGHLTGKVWTRVQVGTLPTSGIAKNQYTIAIYKWKYEHRRRRYFDTLKSSLSVSNGKIIGYYIYTCLGDKDV